MTTTTITKGQAGISLWPADITASGRLVRRGWSASLVPREAMGKPDAETKAAVVQWCGHSHKTTEAAQRCGRAMWDKLPA